MRRLYTQLRHSAAAVHQRVRNAALHMFAPVSGQGLVEYGLVLVLIMVVCVAILTMVGQTVSTVWYDLIHEAFS